MCLSFSNFSHRDFSLENVTALFSRDKKEILFNLNSELQLTSNPCLC